MNGWSLARPVWLFGLCALALPVVIHLLSRGRRRPVAIGSIVLLRETPTARARRVSPSRWVLLLLRCLVLASLALALAGPRRHGGWTAGRPWVLVEPELLQEREALEPAEPELYSALDAALKGGELHPLGSTGDAWSLLRAADWTAPPGVGFRVFTSGRVSELAGDRPALARDVEWTVPSGSGRLNRWVERAGYDDRGELSIVLGASDARATTFRRLSGPTLGLVRVDPGGEAVQLADDDPVMEDDRLVLGPRRPLTVRVVAEAQRSADSAFVVAALRSVSRASDRPLAIESVPPSPGLAAAPLTFWLSPRPVPSELLDSVPAGGVLVSDALERGERCDCLADLDVGARWTAVRFYRRGEVEPADDAAQWVTRQGETMLQAGRAGAGVWLRLRSRFTPEWSDLVLDPVFPEWIAGLIERAGGPPPTAARAGSDRRAAGSETRLPRRVVASADAGRGQQDPLPAWILWLAVPGLLAWERWLAAGEAP